VDTLIKVQLPELNTWRKSVLMKELDRNEKLNNQEIIICSKCRDSLLPKLMSGKIRVNVKQLS